MAEKKIPVPITDSSTGRTIVQYGAGIEPKSA
jgi:hypothetical protein